MKSMRAVKPIMVLSNSQNFLFKTQHFLLCIIFFGGLIACEGSQNNILDRCIKKNIENITTFKVLTPEVFFPLKVKITEKIAADIYKVFPTADEEIFKERTIGDMVEFGGFNDKNVLEDIKRLSSGLMSEEEKKKFLGEGFTEEDFYILMNIFKQFIEAYPNLLKDTAEIMCNEQGVY